MNRAVHNACNLEAYKEAKTAVNALETFLTLLNASALNIPEEGLEETLTLQIINENLHY